MAYTIIAIASSLLCALIGGISNGPAGALVAFATVGLIAGTGHIIKISVIAADKTRPKG